MLAVALLLQVAGPTLPVVTRRGCRPANEHDEVVVCARAAPSPYRVPPLGDPPNTKVRRGPLAVKLPGGVIVGGGTLVRLAVPLGKHKQ